MTDAEFVGTNEYGITQDDLDRHEAEIHEAEVAIEAACRPIVKSGYASLYACAEAFMNLHDKWLDEVLNPPGCDGA